MPSIEVWLISRARNLPEKGRRRIKACCDDAASFAFIMCSTTTCCPVGVSRMLAEMAEDTIVAGMALLACDRKGVALAVFSP